MLRPVSVATSALIVAAVAATAAANDDQARSLRRSGSADGAAKAVPTYAREIAPILDRHCVSCHRPGEVAPMSLRSFQEVRPWATAIRRKVEARTMPPYSLDPAQSLAMRNIRLLSDEEITAIREWASAGAPKGDEAHLPPAREFLDGWNHPSGRPPDYVLEMPAAVDIPASGTMDYQYVYQPIPFPEDRFIEAMEVRVGDRKAVHHINVKLTTLPPNLRIGPDGRLVDEGGQVVNEEVRAPSDAGEPNERAVAAQSGLIGLYLPGNAFQALAPGIGKRLPPGYVVEWSNHYTPYGKPTKDRSRLGLWFNREPVKREAFSVLLGGPLPTDPDRQSRYAVNGQAITRVPRVYTGEPRTEAALEQTGFPAIPAGMSDYQARGETKVNEPITIHSFNPHMHFRGKDARYVVRWPDGREQTLLFVPAYDFNWQFTYELTTPVHIPAGSTLIGMARYDNSRGNRLNPAPDKDVEWGLQSWEEMFGLAFKFTRDRQDLTATSTQPQR